MPYIRKEDGNRMKNDSNYHQALNYLYSFIDYSLTRAFRYSPDKFDLGRMGNLLYRLGDPHKMYKVIHIAGTKGKGSTAAMIASALSTAGYRVGFYTSPHLHDFTERIQVNTQSISKNELVELVEELKPHVSQIQRLTTFELTTALAFLYFYHMKVSVAVIEVGMGGRLDATNLVWPLVSVITSLSSDHTHVLGDTLAKIAAEKAGIIKTGCPVVLAPQKKEAQLIVERVATDKKALLTLLGRDFLFSPWSHSLEEQSLLVWRSDEQTKVDEYVESGGKKTWEPLRLHIPLLGYHQVENAATAYAALQVARDSGIVISEADIKKGFAEVFWPGRFEVLRRSPPVVIDSAHNRDSALKLRLAIDDYFPGKKVILIFGASEDKDVQGMYAELLPRVQQVINTESIHPRAMRVIELVELAHRFGKPTLAILPVERALIEALRIAGNESAVLAAGSIFIAAAVRENWKKLMQ